jgi:TRAP-type C4-dicarboxylate transport system permease small subunit
MRLAGFEDGVNRFSRWCNWLSCVAVVLMMCVVFVNVVLSLFDRPILGAYEYVQLISAVIISFGLAHTGVIKGHVAVDLFMRRFPERIQAVVDTIITTVVLGIVGIVTWGLAKFAYQNFRQHVATESMEIPLYPFIFIISFGFFVLFFVLLNDIVNAIAKVFKR